MARTKAVPGSRARLADCLSASLLARVIPAQGLAWPARAREPVRISKVSISNARAKVGWEPLHELMRRCCVPMAQPALHPDRGFSGHEYWADASATGGQLLWRCPANRALPPLTELPDGSCLSSIAPSGVGTVRAQERAITVRVIEYAMPGLRDGQPPYRLQTTLLDSQVAPAPELAALYRQPRQVEEMFDELKTHLLKSRRVLRSKTAELVRQEFYGWVLAHCTVRWLLHEGATRHRIPRPELPSASHLQLLRREQAPSGAFPPNAAEAALASLRPRAARKRQTARHARTGQA